MVVNTGERTHFGAISAKLSGRRVQTSFDRGIAGFTWLMIKFMVVMALTVFLVLGIRNEDWTQALLCALAIAYKEFPRDKHTFSVSDEAELTLLGYIAFLDPPKDSSAKAIASLRRAGVAKESADVVLLEKSPLVLENGIIKGRRVFGNIIKYIRMGASSNFGNMFSMLGASLWLPFLPMLPVQILPNNLLYDFSQIGIPAEKMDGDYLRTPRKWNIASIRRFMVCIGPASSIFDYATFFLMMYFFNCALFKTLSAGDGAYYENYSTPAGSSNPSSCKRSSCTSSARARFLSCKAWPARR